MGEFDIIKTYFSPLTIGFAGSLSLSDDAAVFAPPPKHELVITKDAICEGVHFIGSESADLIAGKALRVNLSDLAAMGATPTCYFLALMLPKNTSEEWIAKFANGLRETQNEFKIHLAGGDTTATITDKISISITAIGSVPIGCALQRNGAKIGDDIYVSGTLGDAALGLKLLSSLRGAESDEAIHTEKENWIALSATPPRNDNHLISRYLTPQPRLALGQGLRGIANSCMDISDGLLQDLGHICTASNVGAEIYATQIPISEDAKKLDTSLLWYDKNCAFEAAISGGDDYELLFTVPSEKAHLIPKHIINCTKIGKIIACNEVQLFDKNGGVITPSKKGFLHF